MIRIGRMIVGTLGVLAFLAGGMSQAAHAQNKAAHYKAKISAQQAAQTALKKYHGAVVGKAKLENEEGKWQYGIMVRSGKTLREVMVNADTGKIDSAEVTTTAKENAEAKADAAKEKANAAKANKTAKKHGK